jgi:hypothetical protein
VHLSSELTQKDDNFSGLTPEQAAACELRCEGYTQDQVCKALNLKPYWIVKWCAKLPAFERAWQLARDVQTESLADKLLHATDDLTPAMVGVARLQSENVRWLLSKWNRRYGDKLDVNVEHTVNIAGALAEARARLLPMRCQDDADDAEYRVIPSDEGHGPRDKQSHAPDGRLKEDATNATDRTLSE